MLDEPIQLNTYDPSWPASFEAERARIVEALGLDPVAVQHIGSTAIQGMTAKPIIDIMIGVPVTPPPVSWVESLAALGYEAMGEAGVPGRWYFRLRVGPFRNAHVVERDGAHWVHNLAFRDYLRDSPLAAQRYEAAKRAAVATGAVHLVAYSRAKRSTVEHLLREALGHKGITG